MILVVCGPPGVGKTTVAERLQRRLRDDGLDFRLVHSDDFSRNTYEQMYERVTEAGPTDTSSDSSPAGGRTDPETDWILDGTFYRRKLQERFRALPDAHLVYLTASRGTALERNRDRADAIAEEGMDAMHGQFEEPERPDLTLDTEVLSVEEAVDALERYVLTWR